jgi:hypothetical protein
MKFTMRHPIDTDEATFWGKLFFDDEYTRRLFREGLEMRQFDLLELREEPGGAKVRKVRMLPKDEPPLPVRKLLGEPVSEEEGRFDPAARKWTFKVTPHKLADKIKISGEITFSPLGAGKCERVTNINISVDIFGLGGIVEGFIEKTVRDSYDRSATFTNKFIAEKGITPG